MVLATIGMGQLKFLRFLIACLNVVAIMNHYPHSLLSFSTYLCYCSPEFYHQFNRKYFVWHLMQIYLSWIYQSLVQYHFPMARMILWTLRFQLNQMKDTIRKNCSTFCLQKFVQTESSIKTASTNFRHHIHEYTIPRLKCIYIYMCMDFPLPDILDLVTRTQLTVLWVVYFCFHLVKWLYF